MSTQAVPKLSQRLAAELVGSAFLLATVVGSGIMAERLAGGNGAVALLCNSLATGAALVVLVTMLGPVSGAHLNPAVSLVFRLRASLGTDEFAGYLAAQLAGAILGVLAAHAMFDETVWQVSAKVRTGPGQWLSEGIATFGLVLTILGVLRARADMVAICVGLYITAAYWFTASTSFANPAVTLARALTGTYAGIRPEDVVAFVACQLAGAVLASLVARFLFESPLTAARK